MKNVTISEETLKDLLRYAKDIREICEDNHALSVHKTSEVHLIADKIVCEIEDELKPIKP